MNPDDDTRRPDTHRPDRRSVIKHGIAGGVAGSSLLAGLAAAEGPGRQDDKNISDKQDKNQTDSKDRQAVIAAGFTEAEADCWAATAHAAATFFELPELHPMDKSEVASAIHIIQNKLLSRPTYRKYLDFHKSKEAESKN